MKKTSYRVAHEGKLAIVYRALGAYAAVLFTDAPPPEDRHLTDEITPDMLRALRALSCRVSAAPHTITERDMRVWLTRRGQAETCDVLGACVGVELLRRALDDLLEGLDGASVIVDRGGAIEHGLRFRCAGRVLTVMARTDRAQGDPMPLERVVVTSDHPEYRATLYARARAAYGDEAQLDMAIEEAGELVVALQHRKRGRGDEEAVEELADSIIVHEQARIILGAERVEAAIARKLARLDERVTKHEQTKGAKA